jgi:TM2 domain-containing membrane protein YozV
MSPSFTFFGLGQMYAGEYKRGPVIMIIGIAVLIGGRFLVPLYIGIIPMTAYWIWQMIDSYLLYDKKMAGEEERLPFGL